MSDLANDNDLPEFPKDALGAVEDSQIETTPEIRLYATSTDLQVVIKHDWTRECCYEKRPGEDFFHNILGGEIYIKRGTEKLCLACAARKGLVSTERLSWQRG